MCVFVVRLYQVVCMYVYCHIIMCCCMHDLMDIRLCMNGCLDVCVCVCVVLLGVV